MKEKTPLFQEIENSVLKNIENGVFAKGTAIPSEPELAREFGTTRMTVRRAIDELVAKGMLYRVQGKGTFVSHLDLQKMYRNHGFTNNMQSLGYEPASVVLDFSLCRPPPEVAESLQLSAGENVFYLRRIRMADFEAVAVEQVWFSEMRFPKLADYNFEENSLYDVLRSEYNLEAGYSHQKINTAEISGEVAEILFSQKSGTALHIQSVDYDHTLQPITVNSSYYHGRKYTLEVIIK